MAGKNKINNKQKKALKGFTMLEVIFAGFILTVTIFGSYSLIRQTVIGAALNQERLIAYYFAQEGIENIRNKRDTNWLQGAEWDSGIQPSQEEAVNFLDNSPSKFTRVTTVSPNEEENYLEVKVSVQWTTRNQDQSVEVVNRLYSWY